MMGEQRSGFSVRPSDRPADQPRGHFARPPTVMVIIARGTRGFAPTSGSISLDRGMRWGWTAPRVLSAVGAAWRHRDRLRGAEHHYPAARQNL